MDLKETGFEDMNWINLAQDRVYHARVSTMHHRLEIVKVKELLAFW
jgi:hypothetical protein